MVTAAAIGACDTWVRRTGGAVVDLSQLTPILDTAVRRVGGGHLAMTCFAAILDPAAGDLAYVSCGHTVPYLCREKPDGTIDLQALVGRSNPLGSGMLAPARVQHRTFQAGDLVVCYTDGVVDAKDASGKQFGDRRLQLLLKRLDRARLAPATVHDLVQANLTAHRAGQPLADDETVVVAQLAPAA
jgi:serine phosphatase RsbU (regulator of sigma subunit)